MSRDKELVEMAEKASEETENGGGGEGLEVIDY